MCRYPCHSERLIKPTCNCLPFASLWGRFPVDIFDTWWTFLLKFLNQCGISTHGFSTRYRVDVWPPYLFTLVMVTGQSFTLSCTSPSYTYHILNGSPQTDIDFRILMFSFIGPLPCQRLNSCVLLWSCFHIRNP